MQMSKNLNRQKLKKAEDGRSYRILWLKMKFPLYWEEGIVTYPRYRRGYKNPNKYLFAYEMRMYKTWKYNRKTQWKE